MAMAAVLPGSGVSTLEAVAVPVNAKLAGDSSGAGGGTTMGAAWAGEAVKVVGKTAANKPRAAAQASPAVVVLFKALNQVLA